MQKRSSGNRNCVCRGQRPPDYVFPNNQRRAIGPASCTSGRPPRPKPFRL